MEHRPSHSNEIEITYLNMWPEARHFTGILKLLGEEHPMQAGHWLGEIPEPNPPYPLAELPQAYLLAARHTSPDDSLPSDDKTFFERVEGVMRGPDHTILSNVSERLDAPFGPYATVLSLHNKVMVWGVGSTHTLQNPTLAAEALENQYTIFEKYLEKTPPDRQVIVWEGPPLPGVSLEKQEPFPDTREEIIERGHKVGEVNMIRKHTQKRDILTIPGCAPKEVALEIVRSEAKKLDVTEDDIVLDIANKELYGLHVHRTESNKDVPFDIDAVFYRLLYVLRLTKWTNEAVIHAKNALPKEPSTQDKYCFIERIMEPLNTRMRFNTRQQGTGGWGDGDDLLTFQDGTISLGWDYADQEKFKWLFDQRDTDHGGGHTPLQRIARRYLFINDFALAQSTIKLAREGYHPLLTAGTGHVSHVMEAIARVTGQDLRWAAFSRQARRSFPKMYEDYAAHES